MNLTYSGIALSVVLIFVAVGLSYYYRLGIGKELSFTSVRVFLQLIAMGYVLKYILQTEHPLIVLLILSGMVLFGAYTASSREKAIESSFSISFVSIFLGVMLTIGIILAAGIIELKAQYLIPIASMIISNCMNTTSLALNRIKGEFRSHREQIEAALCLGAVPKQAAEPMLKATIKASLIPSMNRAKTVGIVTLPGSMSGMIFAGVSPIQAVKYQILVEYVVIGSVSISVFAASILTYQKFFTKQQQLKYDLFSQTQES